MRTFEELRGNAATWCDSLAYWLGVYRGEPTSEELLSIAGIMARYYDYEERAHAYGRMFPEDNDWPKVFRPIAPVPEPSQ
jgi:hypothetical protein